MAQPTGQPGLQMRQRQGLKPGGVHRRALAHKRKDADVGSARRGTAQQAGALQRLVQGLEQQGQRLRLMVRPVLGIGVTLRVFVAVQVVFEAAIADRHQGLVVRGLRPRPPGLRVGRLRKRPLHDVQALVQHLAAGQHQHRHRAFGRQGQHGGGFVAQRHFQRLVQHTHLQQGHAGPHGIGAAAVGVEKRDGHVLGGSCTFIVTAAVAGYSHLG
jgi:hypothetical protein